MSYATLYNSSAVKIFGSQGFPNIFTHKLECDDLAKKRTRKEKHETPNKFGHNQPV